MGNPTLEIADFYPRSPCGERRYPHQRGPRRLVISIHALLAESDKRPAQMLGMTKQISIHALLAESDWQSARRGLAPGDFYPRSPCGERLAYRPGLCYDT